MAPSRLAATRSPADQFVLAWGNCLACVHKRQAKTLRSGGPSYVTNRSERSERRAVARRRRRLVLLKDMPALKGRH